MGGQVTEEEVGSKGRPLELAERLNAGEVLEVLKVLEVLEVLGVLRC